MHNEDIRQDIRHRTSSRLVATTYGSMGRQRRSLKASAGPKDEVDAAGASASASVEVLTATDEHDPLQVDCGPSVSRLWCFIQEAKQIRAIFCFGCHRLHFTANQSLFFTTVTRS